MHRSVRIYEHRVKRLDSSAPRRVLMTSTQRSIADWLPVDWALAIAGAKLERTIIAVGCEEGAMTVHLA